MSQEQPSLMQNEPSEIASLVQILRGLGEFYFWPNNGNLGDYLLAEAARQIFRQFGLPWRPYNPATPPQEESYVLVYGGGGRFVPHWGGIDRILEHLTRPEMSRCVIMPHSICGVDSFVQALDARHTVFCRERRTYEYCVSLNQRATFLMGHDVGLSLNVEQLPAFDSLRAPHSHAGTEATAQYHLMSGAQKRRVWFHARRATVRVPSTGRKVAFMLRTDKEKSVAAASEWSFDLSSLWSGNCQETVCGAHLMRFMADITAYPDVVVTDRLHVAIMSMHTGRVVYMLDNDYGKLSGVYEQSLKGKENVHLLSGAEPWPAELQEAWTRLNAPLRSKFYRTARWVKMWLMRARRVFRG